jgi:hypothetical protein
MKVSQPTNNPTNKLAAATVGAAVAEVTRVVVGHMWPDFADPAMWTALTPLIVFGFGWFMSDAPNMVVKL